VIVLDASVILKWIWPDEPLSAAAMAYRDQHISGTNRVAVPELSFYEMANALATKTHLSAEEAIEDFTVIGNFELDSHNLGQEELSEAIRLSKRFHISLYDSSYITLANALGCELITADAQLVKKVKSLPYVKLLQ
jgi:predicted nucleic acid-binding protein